MSLAICVYDGDDLLGELQDGRFLPSRLLMEKPNAYQRRTAKFVTSTVKQVAANTGVRELAVKLLDDNEGITTDAYDTLRNLLDAEGGSDDIILSVRSQDDRCYLPEDWADHIDPPKPSKQKQKNPPKESHKRQ